MMNKCILNMKTLELLGQLNIDPIHSYEAIKSHNKYEVIIHWYRDDCGYFSKRLFSARRLTKLNKLLAKELHRLCK